MPQQLPNNANYTVNGLTNTSANLTWVVNPTTVVDLKSGFHRNAAYNNDSIRTNPSIAEFLSSHPISGMPLTSGGFPFYPETSIPGYDVPNQNSIPFPTNIFQEQGSVSIIRGRHAIKMGFEMLRTQSLNDGNGQPTFIFSSVPTSDPENPAATGSALASYLLGLPSEGRRNVGVTAGYMRQTDYSGYLQDDINWSPS